MADSDETKRLLDYIKSTTKLKMSVDEYTLYTEVPRRKLMDIMHFLKFDKKCEFDVLLSIHGVDYPKKKDRFAVLYTLLSMSQNKRCVLKTYTDKSLPSISSIFDNSIWYEREVYDMYGVEFDGNDNKERILCDYGFEGHPLRKDFPLTGYVELRYNDEKKEVEYEKVNLTQEFRTFDFISPWEGTKYDIKE